MKTGLLVGIVTLLMSFSGCEREEVVQPVNINELIGEWKLVEPGSFNVTLVIDPVAQTLQLPSVPRLNLSGKSLVNTYNSSLSYKDNKPSEITISEISATQMAGSSEAMQFEQTYFANLKAVNRYELTSNNRLRLYYDGAQTGTLVYEKTN
ncbi:META domain-containing protein [Spirosoma jeollabukense]